MSGIDYLNDASYPGISAAPVKFDSLKMLSNILRSGKDLGNKVQIPDWMPLIGDQGLGDLVLGKSPEEVEQWAYGNSPFTSSSDRSGTGSLIPNLKSNRRQGFADAAMLGLEFAPGAKALATATHGVPVGLSVKPVKSKAKGSVGAVFSDDDTYSDALKKALRGEHLKRTNDGKYVGGPADLMSPQKLASNRGYADQKVREGAFNANWYDRATGIASDISGYNPSKHGYGTGSDEGKMASLFARGGAAYSPQATPDYQVNAILKQHNAKILGGEDRFPKTGAQGRNVASAYDYNPVTGQYDISPERIGLGKKTGPYGDATDPTVDPSTLYKTANDIWHGRVMGYGKDFKRGFTPQEHGFLTGENLLLADRANKGNYGAEYLGTDFNWNPRAAQAATWGGERLAQYAAAQKKAIAKALRSGKRPPKEKTPEELLRLARLGIDDAIPNRVANENYEFVTGENVGHLKGLNAADDATRADYTNRAADAFLLDGNRDPIYDAFQMFQLPTLRTEGKYLNSAGVMETNPGLSARPLVSLTNSDLGLTKGGKAKRGGSKMTDQEAQAMSHAQLLRSYLLGQEGVGRNKFTLANSSMKGFEKNGLSYLPEKGDDLSVIASIFEKEGLDVVNNGDNLTIGSFAGDVAPKVIQATGKKLTKSKAAPGEIRAGRFESSLEKPNWVAEEGTGGTTRDLLERLLNNPDYAVHDSAKKLGGQRFKESVGGLNKVDEEFSKQTGMPVRKDLMLARKIISESGVQGLIDYVKKTGGKGLPAALLAPGALDQWLSDEGLKE